MASKTMKEIADAFNQAMPETTWKVTRTGASISLFGKGDLKASVTTMASRLFVQHYRNVLGNYCVPSVTYVADFDHTVITWSLN